MDARMPALPKHLWLLLAAYFIASLAHFVHNAEYIAMYPGMPSSLTRETVYLAWLGITGITGIGALGFALLRFGAHAAGVLVLGIYGAFGLDGLAHYTLALCSEHTLFANITIWAEAVAGSLLFLASVLRVIRRTRKGALVGPLGIAR